MVVCWQLNVFDLVCLWRAQSKPLALSKSLKGHTDTWTALSPNRGKVVGSIPVEEFECFPSECPPLTVLNMR